MKKSELDIAHLLCRGRVGSSRQQLLRKFSTDQTPIQFGVDYSKTKPVPTPAASLRQQSSTVVSGTTVQINNKPRSTFVGSKNSPSPNYRQPSFSSQQSSQAPTKLAVSKTSIHLSPISEPKNAQNRVSPQLLAAPAQSFESVTNVTLQTSPHSQRKIVRVSSSPHSSSQLLQSGSDFTEEKLQIQFLERPNSIRLTPESTSTHKACPSNATKSTLLSPQSEPESSCFNSSSKKRHNTYQLLDFLSDDGAPATGALLSTIAEPPLVELVTAATRQRPHKMSKLTTAPTVRKSSRTPSDRVCESMDPSLVSVAQRAKSLMLQNTAKQEAAARIAAEKRRLQMEPAELLKSVVNPEQQDENQAPVLCLQDRIKLYKDSAATDKESQPQESVARQHRNRFKTQPISLDDIARANAMILDQTDVASTIASPSISNSRETLVDISEDCLSPLGRDMYTNNATTNTVKKLNRVQRAQTCLINPNTYINRSIDEEEIPNAVSVKEIIKLSNQKLYDSSSSEDVNPVKPVKNTAISRKLAFKNKTNSEDKESTPHSKVYGRKVHLTQPISKLDIDEAEMNKDAGILSISDRIANINESGTRWKGRVDKSDEVQAKPRPGSIYVIQDQLQNNQETWKTRVEEKDAEQFTTKAKLKSAAQKTNRYSYHGSTFKEHSPTFPVVHRLFKQSSQDDVKVPDHFILECNVQLEDNDVFSGNKNLSTTITTDNNRPAQLQGHSRKVAVPQNHDSSLSNFFASPEISPENEVCSIQPTSDDFDDIFLNTGTNLGAGPKQTRGAQHARRRTAARSGNPLRNLAARPDIRTEYDETAAPPTALAAAAAAVVVGSASSGGGPQAGLAAEALAGLSSKEDFSRVQLRRQQAKSGQPAAVTLVLVKGRKRVQARVVRPTKQSVNCGDCYLLVSLERVIVWLGEAANVIETNKAQELGSVVARTKLLQYRGVHDSPLLLRSGGTSGGHTDDSEFWRRLGYDSGQICSLPGDDCEDELYEQRMPRSNMTFRVDGPHLRPVEEAWARTPRFAMLHTEQVLLFDFGSELYLWSGSRAPRQDRLYGREFLRQLRMRGYDYSGCAINPLDPLPADTLEEAVPLKGNTRPDWIIEERLPQNGETMLFKEKFLDWPDTSRLIRVGSIMTKSLEKKTDLDRELEPADLDLLLAKRPASVHVTIDGKSVGRGGRWRVQEDGIWREFEVVTKRLDVWLIRTNAAVRITEPSAIGQFSSGSAYIIRWEYDIKTLGRYNRVREAASDSSVFFFWQGQETSITEKTASALLTVELGKDYSGASGSSSQIRVLQHEESPCFCRLFCGAMMVHRASGEQASVKLFVLRGEVKLEAHFVEVELAVESLRSRGIYLLVERNTGGGWLWQGRLTSPEVRSAAAVALEAIQTRKPKELLMKPKLVLTVETVEEEREPRSFWQMMGAVKRRHSNITTSALAPLRCWEVSAVTMAFVMTELKYSLQPDPPALGDDDDDSGTTSKSVVVPTFPLVQTTLYSASQPSLFLVWSPQHIYLWQGYWPHMSAPASQSSSRPVSTVSEPGDLEQDSVEADIAADAEKNWALPINRIAAEKLAVLRTIHKYVQKHKSEDVTASIVYAGLEPVKFQELFPFWNVDDTARTANLKKGYSQNQEDNIREVLNSFMNAKFSVEQLRQKPLPEVVIPWKIESYLTDLEFQKEFKMTKEEFYLMTPWKQNDLKREVNLF